MRSWVAVAAGLLAGGLLGMGAADLLVHVRTLQARVDASDVELRRAHGELETARAALARLGESVGTLEARLEPLQAPAPDAPRRAALGDVDGLHRDVLSPSVQVNGRGGVGGGTILFSRGDHTFAITAYHVVGGGSSKEEDGPPRIEVRVYDAGRSRSFPAELVASDEKKDLALVRLRAEEALPHVARLASRETLRKVKVFTPVYAVGCPLGHDPLPTVGEVATLHKEVAGETFWMVTAPTIFGNSGGGIFHRETHELLGVSVMICTYDGAVTTPVPHLGILVSLDAVYDWLDELGYEFVYEGNRP